MEPSFDLFLLDQESDEAVLALARRGADTAIERLPLGSTLAAVMSFGAKLGMAVTGNERRPSATDLEQFGADLFAFLFRGTLRALYDRLPRGAISLQILSNRPEIQAIPWEYLLTPDYQPVPHRHRSVVRVHPTCGVDSPAPKRLGKNIRVLFVSADPVDQAGVAWEDVVATIERAFAAHLPRAVSLKIVPGATRQSLIAAITQEEFDIFHFYGHGVLHNNIGHLVLQDIASGASDLVSASQLAVAISGKGVHLAILSACLTGAGRYRDDFGVIATALIRAGIPAVVANQYPIPYESISPFVASVYASLAVSGDIDRAVADGRAALSVGLSNTLGSDAVLEWGIPTLYRLADARKLFQ